MAKLPRLTPFWYTPEGQEEGEQVSFLLRPLTQPQMIEVEEHYVNGKQTGKAQYVAGRLGIIQVKGYVHPQTGEQPVIPSCFDWLPRSWVKLCGARLIAEDHGIDWDELMGPLKSGEAPREHKQEEDPEGN